jgi:hypothetical protein
MNQSISLAPKPLNLKEETNMKAVTEFSSFTLNKALLAKNQLTTDGKSTEEIQQNLGESFKLQEEKLNYFMNAIEVASQNTEKLTRVVVIRLNDGEVVPAKAVQMGELYYLPEFFNMPAPKAAAAPGKGPHRGGDKKGKNAGPKESPWGLSPEQKAAKKLGQKAK